MALQRLAEPGVAVAASRHGTQKAAATKRKRAAPRRRPKGLRVTAAMKRAGTEVLNGAREMYPEELVAEIYTAMVAAGGMVGNG